MHETHHEIRMPTLISTLLLTRLIEQRGKDQNIDLDKAQGKIYCCFLGGAYEHGSYRSHIEGAQERRNMNRKNIS